MSGYGLFQPATLGMQSQSHKLNTIGYNIANVNTGGFKRTDTAFQTVLSDNEFNQWDNGGVLPISRATNDVQGLIQGSNRPLDLAISGDGFFSVQPELTGTDTIYFTRDGSFEVNTVDGQTSSVTADDGSTISVNNGYLVDKNGYFLRGVPANEDGTFSSSAAAPMRVDQYAFIDQGQPTTAADLEFNLPANAGYGDDAITYTLQTYDSASAERNISLDFSRQLSNNQWRVDARADNLTSATLSPGSAFSLTTGTTPDTVVAFDAAARSIQIRNNTTGNPVANSFEGLAEGDTFTVAGSPTTNDGTYTVSQVIDNGATLIVEETPATETTALADTVAFTSSSALTDALVFDANGALQSPTELTYTATWDDGETSEFTIDLTSSTQFNGDFKVYRKAQNGLGLANITDLKFDNAGHVIGTFSDGTERSIYKVPLYNFTNPNGLDTSNGMLFSETTESGFGTAFFADESSRADFIPSAVEISNVDVAQEFTQMIQTQTAYNMNATSFKTIDEMTTVARDLKA